MAELRALTVRQPFAGAIIWFGKDVENRTRRMSYTGLLLIHSALAVPDWHDFLAVGDMARPGVGINVVWSDERRTLGAILGTVQVSGCHHAEDCATGKSERRARCCSPWAVRHQFHIELTDPQPLSEPVPCRGMPGLWRLPEDVDKAVRAQLGGGRG